MTISFPRTDVFCFGGVADSEFSIGVRKEFSRTADGRTIGRLLGPTLWRCTVTSGPLFRLDASTLRARLATLEEEDQMFTAHDVRRPYPASDPRGVQALTGITVHTVGANTKSLRLQGLPDNFVVSEGDYVEIAYSSGRKGLHQAAETVTASGAGLTPTFEIVPHIKPGASAGLAVSLKKARANFRVAPDSVAETRINNTRWQLSWSGVQDWF